MKEITNEVLTLKREKFKEKYSTLEAGVYTEDGIIEFERQYFFEDNFSLFMPVSFIDMPEEIAKIKYPSVDRPQIIKTSEDGGINLTFSTFKQMLNSEDVEDYIKGLQSTIKHMQPANVFFQHKVITLDTTTVSWFDFKGYAFDDQVYNFMYVVPIENGIVLGNFNCLFSLYNVWKPIVLQMLDTIQDESKNSNHLTKNL